MANFAPVCPPQILTEFKRAGELGDYHLVLAHDIVKRSKEYMEIFDRPRHSPMTVILDNSVIELGGAVDLDVIVEAAHIVQATSVVLPDVLLDTDATIKSCMDALPKWTNRFVANDLGANFMIVPQGKTPSDWIRCAEAFAEEPGINFWGIPRNVVKLFGTRRGLPNIAFAINSHRHIHLLGFSDDVVDDVLTSHNPLVTGIDSAVPIRAVSQSIPISFAGTLNKMPPRGTWWEDATYNPKMLDAYRKVQDWVKG